MEIVQTCTGTWPWGMGMSGARFAVFVRRARVLPSPCHATRNLSFWRFHRHRHPVVSTRNFYWTGTGWCENSTRWKSCKQVQTRGRGAWACLAHALQCLCDGRVCCPARALQLVICRSGGFTGTVTLLFQLVIFTGNSTGWRENSTRWKSCKQVQARGRGACACLAHALQCLCDGCACCPARAMQLVICRSGGFTGTVTLLFQLVVSLEIVRVGVKIPQDGNRANRYRHVAVGHGHVWRTLCSVCATGACVAQPVPCNS
jgi:hypothetical protein